jgi:hypothetical protein
MIATAVHEEKVEYGKKNEARALGTDLGVGTLRPVDDDPGSDKI